ncbi:MAG: glycosyltransferase family 4 protein [Candidatus Aenigmarchaeota archaeon]|nr:glycosyltransferase family 4 protein [Candidatus Aenigmarchaeota archaeon]
MKVLFVLDYFPPHVGGAETLFDNMTRELSRLGVGVTILTQRLPNTKAFEISQDRRIHRIYSPVRHAFAVVAAKKCIRLANNSDIVHAATLGGLAAVALVEKFIKKPVVATIFEVWGGLFLKLQKPPMSVINYVTESASLDKYKKRFCVAISRATKNALVKNGFDEKKVSVVYPGVDINLFNRNAKLSLRKKKPTILFLGRPGVAKGINYLIKAMPMVKAALPEARLLLLLSKNPAGEYKKTVSLVAKLNLSDSVEFLDPRPVKQLPGIIKSADVCVVPSVSEGFGFSAAEAAACGTPVVASNTGSLPEIVKNGYNGLLSEPANPGSIAKNVIKVLSDKNLRRRLSLNGPRSVKTFRWDKAAKEYLKIYKSVLK